jgi:predicted acetyltransferase
MKDKITINSFVDKNRFHDLFQLYLSDLSQYNHNLEMDEKGLYPAPWIDGDWDLPEFIPLRIEQNNDTCGFILLSKKPFSKPGTDWCIQEFFILSKFRNKGYGYSSVEQLFNKYSGSYSMAVMKDNVPAKYFWEKTLDLMGIQYTKEKHSEEGIDGLSYVFTVPNILKK